jgi:hypothetical protein
MMGLGMSDEQREKAGKDELTASPVERGVMCFRCGYCGQPTDKDGQVLPLETIKAISVDWDKAEQTHGDCCRQEQETRRMQVTKEMAMDAGEPDMEGMWIER